MRATKEVSPKSLLALALAFAALPCLAQQYPPLPAAPSNSPPDMTQSANLQPAPLLAPGQLDALLAPVALYPDPLLSQILAASTYPLEIVEASRWLDQNHTLQSAPLVDAARSQGWDPSVAALVAFPDVLKNLDRDIRWTSSLGNAFLAQQGDVMDAVQRLRRRAQASGALQTSQEEAVTTETQGNQSAIDIEPADPQMIYVPQYDPMSVWGAPMDGFYPLPWYPGVAFGFGFGAGIGLDAYFGGCCAWGGGGWGWGWRPHWFDRNIYVDNYFLNRYGYQDFGGRNFQANGVWQHSPRHRLGVPYSGRDLAARFGNAHVPSVGQMGARYTAQFGSFQTMDRGGNAKRQFQLDRFGASGFERANTGGNRSVFSGIGSGGRARLEGGRGFAGMRGGYGGFRATPASSFRGGGASFHGGASRGRGR